ncbi:M28 family peptidase [Candidatus Latescibacterota bacterium]
MTRFLKVILLFAFILSTAAETVLAVDMEELINVIQKEISGERAREYTMRLWQYDRWYNMPMMKKSAAEAHAIMKERGFDEAEIVNTPADGVTQHGTWTNPIGWDVKQATLEIVEPANVPDEYKYLCNYLHNPTSLIGWSCPTPKEGITAELILLENASAEGLSEIDSRGKIVFISAHPGGMKRHLDKNGALGLVSDYIEGHNTDFIHANNWMNTWSDNPGGWLMNASDSRNNFGFSISQKKGTYLRNLLQRGRKVVVRATVDSRYYTDDVFPYVAGGIKGTGSEDVVIFGHLFEWGANDNSTGCASIIEALGTLNDLILSGVLPRPKRSIRAWLGQELYGSLAYTAHNLERLRTKTIAAVCCDTAAENYDSATTVMNVMLNFNACPSFTDAVFPEIAGTYFDRYAPNRPWLVKPFSSGKDDFFGEPMIGVPLNAISMNNGGHLHHNSMDTIEKTDPRTLRELTILNAAYLYYMADAGLPEVPLIAQLRYDMGVNVILAKTKEMMERLSGAGDGTEIGKVIYDGTKAITYYTELQKTALSKIEQLVSEDEKEEVKEYLKPYLKDLDTFCKIQLRRFNDEAKRIADVTSVKIVKFVKKDGDWERDASTIIPRRTTFGSLTFDGIPVEEWREVRSAPRWWSATNWGLTSYWWSDGKRNLNEIKELMELEAGTSVRNFDLINYFKFLEKFGMVEFQ